MLEARLNISAGGTRDVNFTDATRAEGYLRQRFEWAKWPPVASCFGPQNHCSPTRSADCVTHGPCSQKGEKTVHR